MRLNRQFLSLSCALGVLCGFVPLALGQEDMSWPGADNGAPAKKQAKEGGDLIFDGSKLNGKEQKGAAAREESFSGQFHKEAAVTTPAAPARSARPARKASRAKASSRRTTTLVGSAKTTMLFGRIDQIAAEADVKMPVLKAQTARMDTRAPRRLTASTSQTRFSGRVTRSFPMDFSGVWGGHLRVWRYNASSLSYQEDSAEANKMQKILTPGTSGNVNFVFRQENGGIELTPAKVRIMIPMQESYTYQQMKSQLGGLGGMVSKMMANQKIPVMLHFGGVSTSGTMEVGVSGNQIDQRVVKNVIRRLKPGVLEQQIITRNQSVVKGTGQVHNGYTETVLRFTRRSPSDLYVLAASVDYDGSRNYLRKLIMYGDVFRNQRMDTSIYPAGLGRMTGLAGTSGAAGGARSLQSLGGLGALSSLLGGGGGASSASLQQYSNNPALRNYLSRSGIGGGAAGSRVNGFSQVLKSLNMINR